VIGRAAGELREEVVQEEEAAAALKPPVPSNSELMKKSLIKLNKPSAIKRRLAKGTEVIDPMDPSAYSDVPR
jgi:hypothetical protein